MLGFFSPIVETLGIPLSILVGCIVALSLLLLTKFTIKSLKNANKPLEKEILTYCIVEDRMKFNRTMPSLPQHITFIESLFHSIKVLHVNGYLTDKERDRVQARIEKEYISECKKQDKDYK